MTKPPFSEIYLILIIFNLNKNNNFELLNYWNLDLTERAKKDKYFNEQLNSQCKLIEKEIDLYEKNNKKIIELKEQKINEKIYKWWLYFGK